MQVKEFRQSLSSTFLNPELGKGTSLDGGRARGQRDGTGSSGASMTEDETLDDVATSETNRYEMV